MRLAVHDQTDELFAHLLLFTARRRGHVAKDIGSLDQTGDVLNGDPAAVLLGIDRLDERAIGEIARLHLRYPDAGIFVAAEESDPLSRLSAITQGATDVVAKPVLPAELIVRAELARPPEARNERAQGPLRVGDLEVDLERVHAVKANQALFLTRVELHLLYCLMQHRGGVAPTARLLTFGQESEEEVSALSLKTHISHLRRKLEAAGGVPVGIRSRQNLGYVLDTQEAA